MAAEKPWSPGESVLRMAARAAPVGKEALAIAVDDHLQRRRHSLRETADQVAIKVDDDELLKSRLQDERLGLLLVEALEAAGRSAMAEKRRLLAQVIARGVLDDAEVDEAQLVVEVLRDLDAPHLRALERFRRIEDEAERTAEEGAPGKARRSWIKAVRLRGPAAVLTVSGARNEMVSNAVSEAAQEEPEPVRSALIRTGVATPLTTYRQVMAINGVSQFGRRLLDDLNAAASEVGGSDLD